MITGDLKGLLSIKIKSRHDGFSDQYNRIFTMKILLVCSLVMGINWYKDSVNCIVPDSAKIKGDFVSAACWIQGVYVYREMQDKIDRVSYYGIPLTTDLDGMMPDGSPCQTKNKFNQKSSKMCTPLTKTFFLQYQWMPFYIAALSILFYFPYVCYLYGNGDLISLKKSLKLKEAESSILVQTYFNHRVNHVRQLRARILFNYFIKLLYIAANLVSFLATDKLLNGKFIDYGTKWIRWSKLDNHIAHDYMGMRDFPKPGNEMLPPFGYCEVYESASDIRASMANKHKFLCEMSQNVLYQYCLILIWFTLVFGIIISSVGLIMHVIDHLITFMCVLKHGTTTRRMYQMLTLRECEYLEFIRRRDIPLYAEVIEKLRVEKYHMELANGNSQLPCRQSPPPDFDEVTRL